MFGAALLLVFAAMTEPALAATPQTITFNNPGSQNFGTSPTLSATTTSALTVTLTSVTTNVCTITSTGILTTVAPGTCTIHADQAGNATFDPAPTVSQSFTIVVPGGSVILTTSSPLPAATGGSPYTATITAFGGAPPYTFQIVGGTFPTGLVLSPTGALSGVPVSSGTFTFRVRVTDAATITDEKDYQLTINAPGIALSPAAGALPAGRVGTAYTSLTLSASGGIAPYSFAVTSGSLPVGLALSATGVISGTPTKAGNAGFTVTATDNLGFQGAQSYTLAIDTNTADSARLRALQLEVTKVVAQSSGQAISGAIDDAIADGLDTGDGTFMTSGPNGMRFNFAADPDDDAARIRTSSQTGDTAGANAYSSDRGAGRSGRAGRSARIDDAFNAIDGQMPTKAPPNRFREQKNWLLWFDVRATGIDRWTASTTFGAGATQSSLSGVQVNTLMGLTYRVRPDFVVGVLGGYETFNYTVQDINGKLTGDGWTVGSYLGWKISPTLRYDAAVAYSGIGYDGTAGTAQGNFNGQRWLVSTGLTGTYKAAGFVFEPSAKVYALWEHEGAYTDTLGTLQSDYNFATGRASAGVKVAYPFAGNDAVVLMPYVGMYGDYYFNQDNAPLVAAGGIPLASTLLLDGYSARVTAGLNAKFASSGTVGVGAEYGGIGADFQIWTFKAKAQVPF